MFVVWSLRRRSILSASECQKLKGQFAHAESLQDPVRRILEAEKVVDRLLGALGYTGSFGDKLKAAGPRLPNIQALWDAHKLRNRLAHEPGATANGREADAAVRAFAFAVRRFIG